MKEHVTTMVSVAERGRVVVCFLLIPAGKQQGAQNSLFVCTPLHGCGQDYNVYVIPERITYDVQAGVCLAGVRVWGLGFLVWGLRFPELRS